MNIRAVLFDIYGTLFEVGEPPADAEVRWQRLFEESLGTPPPLDRKAFAAATAEAVARQHAVARARGVPHPEVLWPVVLKEVVPALCTLAPAALEEFALRQMQVERKITLHPEAAEVLRRLQVRGCRMGLVSNSQAYTRRELGLLLRAEGLDPGWFDPFLCFFSYEHGYAKPDPHVFQWISTRLAMLGLPAGAAVMVGDRLDNDILPAQAFGLQTWHLQNRTGDGGTGGNWTQFRNWLEPRLVPGPGLP